VGEGYLRSVWSKEMLVGMAGPPGSAVVRG
jgi:hypothetical protein